MKTQDEALRQAYLAANHDPGQKEAWEDWKTTVGDGLDEAALRFCQNVRDYPAEG